MVRRIEAKNVLASLYDRMEDDLLQWGLLVGAGISLLTLGLAMCRNHGPKSYPPDG